MFSHIHTALPHIRSVLSLVIIIILICPSNCICVRNFVLVFFVCPTINCKIKAFVLYFVSLLYNYKLINLKRSSASWKKTMNHIILKISVRLTISLSEPSYGVLA